VSEYHRGRNVAKLKGAQALMSVNKSGTKPTHRNAALAMLMDDD